MVKCYKCVVYIYYKVYKVNIIINGLYICYFYSFKWLIGEELVDNEFISNMFGVYYFCLFGIGDIGICYCGFVYNIIGINWKYYSYI